MNYFSNEFKNIFGNDYITDEVSKDYANWIRETFKSEIVKVPVRHEGMTGSGYSNRCHHNVQLLVNTYGGSRIGGFIVVNNIKIRNENVIELLYHSIWMTPENKIVDVTANNFTEDSQINFLPVVIEDILGIQFDDIILEKRGVLTQINKIPAATNNFAKRNDFKLIQLGDDPENIYALIPFVDFQLDFIFDKFTDDDKKFILERALKEGGFRNQSSATGKTFKEILSKRKS